MIFSSPILTIIFFAINGFFSLACAYRIKQVFSRSQADYHKNFFGFFLSLGLFFVFIFLSGLVFWQNFLALKIGFIIAQFFLFLSLGFFLAIPSAIWMIGWERAPIAVFGAIGASSGAALVLYYDKTPTVVAGFISWNLPQLMGWLGFLVSAFVATASAIFFIRGARTASDPIVKKRSYYFASASIILLISSYFWVASASPGLPIAYVAALAGYLVVYLGVYSIK